MNYKIILSSQAKRELNRLYDDLHSRLISSMDNEYWAEVPSLRDALRKQIHGPN